MRWSSKPKPDPLTVAHLCDALGIETPIAALLAQRGINSFDSAKRFFRPDLKDLHDPFLMKDMELAVPRILRAIQDRENILVYGDYDVDGTTSVAMMTTFLKNRGANVASYIPDRYNEGYGISVKGIDFASDNDVGLIIALDCGIKAVDKIDYAREKGIDFIICDHHRPGEILPRAVAVLDPKRKDCSYPYKELCGCGVGFKLLQALTQAREEAFETLLPYLDLVATAVGADIVPVTGENRILAFHGLRLINVSPRPGLKAILELSGRKEVSMTEVNFVIAPRINAAGRMKHGLHAVDLLMEENEQKAFSIAREVEAFNLARREADRTITEEALAQIEELQEQDRLTTVVYREDWHKGVIGIVASRLTETYYRPTLVFTRSGEKLAASARSVKGFDVYDALESCKDHIEQFGGHKYAAGLTLVREKYHDFKSKFEEIVASTIDRNLLTAELQIDLEIEPEDITPKFYRILKQFEPFGPGNAAPLFLSRRLRGEGRVIGKSGKHLRCVLRKNDRSLPPAVGFSLGKKLELLDRSQFLQAVYSVEMNQFRGISSLQLKLKDLREEIQNLESLDH